MRFRIVRLVFGLLMLGGLLARADDFQQRVEKETFSLINQYRTAHDLPALTWSDAIAVEARGHSRDMATGDVDFGHDGFKGRVEKIKAVLGGFGGAGENVFMTNDLNEVARLAVETWLHSPHHLENIRGDYNYSAVGVWPDPHGTLYFTQIFFKREKTRAASDAATEPELVTPFGMLTTPDPRARP